MLAEGLLPDTRSVEYLAERLAAVPGVVAVTLGGSRAVGAAVEGSDWDFGLYYRGGLDPADISALGWPGWVFAPGEWGSIVNGGAWLTVDGAKVDLIYRDLDEVLRWTAAAADGRFEIRREVGYVAGIATYILAGELALESVAPPALFSFGVARGMGLAPHPGGARQRRAHARQCTFRQDRPHHVAGPQPQVPGHLDGRRICSRPLAPAQPPL